VLDLRNDPRKGTVRGTFGMLAATALLAGFAVLHPVAEQGGDPQRFVTRTDVVVVDVSVHDRQRQPVTGLRATDFTVLEDGRPQAIEYFQEIALPGQPDVPADWLRDVAPDVARNADVAERRLIVILMDDAVVPFDPWMVNSARQIARGVIDRLGPDDLAAVVFTRDNRPAQNFTNDRARLAAAVSRFESAGFVPLPLEELRREPAALAPILSSVLSLFHTVETLASIPERRKSVVLISSGFPLPVDSSEVGLSEFPNLIWLTRQTILQAQRGNVNIHPVDPGGLDGLRTYMLLRNKFNEPWLIEQIERAPAMYRDFLRTLADRTGGRTYTNTNEFASRVEQIIRDTGTFYLLGYRPAAFREDGRFRRLQVRVKQPGTTVTARTGYYAPSPPNPSFSVPPAVESALAGLLPKSDLPLTLTATPFAQAGTNEAAVAVLVSLPAATANGAPRADTVDLLVHAYDTEGRSHGSDQLRADVPAQGGDYELHTQLTLRPGRYELRLSADSAAHGTSGSVYQSITVPDFRGDPLTASGVVLSATPAPAAAPRDRFAGLLPFSPTVRRTFSTTDRVEGLLRLYQGGAAPLAPLTVRMTITTAANEVVFDRPLRIGSDEFDGRAFDYRFDLPLTRLQPGPHLLTLEVTGPAALRRDVRFEVR
jgi:VWFA-related protein